MITIAEEDNFSYECYDNGKHVILSRTEINDKAKHYNYIWDLESDLYAWNIDGYKDRNQVYKITGKIAIEFGLLVHTRKKALTIDDVETKLYNDEELECSTFISLAAKFNRIFKIEKPFLRVFYHFAADIDPDDTRSSIDKFRDQITCSTTNI